MRLCRPSTSSSARRGCTGSWARWRRRPRSARRPEARAAPRPRSTRSRPAGGGGAACWEARSIRAMCGGGAAR
eukprot:3722767-Prymnesium_polylepis.2